MAGAAGRSAREAAGGIPVLLAVAILAGSCSSADTTPPSTTDPPTDTRPPLADPPDPGPVPDTDGLTDEQRREIVAGTVRVTGLACGIRVEGSGFAVGPDLVATNAHVLVGVDDPMVETVHAVDLTATVVAFDAVNDLALLRVPGADLVPFALGAASDGTIGTLVGWEDDGRPEPRPFRIDRPITVRIDEVAGDNRVERSSWLVATEIDSGDSGAALVDGDGVVVGVAYATTRRDAGVAYATRSVRLEELLAEAEVDSVVAVPDCG